PVQRTSRPPKGEPAENDGWKSAAQAQRLLHELRVHQIELEMQNEELRVARAEGEALLQRYTDLYDFAPVGYLTLSLNGSMRELNLPAARLLGRERSRLVGGRFRTFVTSSARLGFDSWLASVFALQDPQTCEVVLIRDALPPLSVQLEAKLAVDEQSVRAVVTDITSRKALEEELRQAQKMEVIGQLAGGVAHDFNSILAAMLLNLGMLRVEGTPAPETETALQNLDELAQRASSLTRQLLLFSRRQILQPKRVELNVTLVRLFELLEHLVGERISCTFHPGTLEMWVEADVAMLEQAVMNLCLNGRDAMPNGGTLSLETSLVIFDAAGARVDPKSRPGQFVCVQVSDTGSGMSAEVQEHLFEPFFTTKEVGKGSGLGLASVYGTVQQHQGWLNVQSQIGHGTTVRLYLPQALKEKTVPAPAPKLIDTAARGETILVVEDDPALLAVTARALARLGYHVLTAADGRQALIVWDQHDKAIDLLLTDVRMPKGMSGLVLAERLAQAKPALKIIIMSGYSAEMSTQREQTRVEFSFLAKPFELEPLAATVRICLDQRQTQTADG
ncbi:MAG TPA: response regulator, partial [Polyangiaceae bacterium]|nr:response regulator [Polyangiaceae bacterium]